MHFFIVATKMSDLFCPSKWSSKEEMIYCYKSVDHSPYTRILFPNWTCLNCIFLLLCHSWIEISLWNFKYVITVIFKYMARDAILIYGEACLLRISAWHSDVSCFVPRCVTEYKVGLLLIFIYELRRFCDTLISKPYTNLNSFLLWPPHT